MTVRVLIADDHGVIRDGLSSLIDGEANFSVIGEASSAEEAVTCALETRPDLVVMDISMPEMGGIEATRHIKEQAPEVRILMLTVHEDKELMRAAIRAGAGGYVLKRAIKSELLHAINTVLDDQLYVHPVMTRIMLMAMPEEREPAMAEPDVPLTPREIDVLRLLAQGYTNRQTGEILGISVRTVEYHRANLIGKLRLDGRVELIRYSEEHGLL
ncbi:MAG: response regulator transcription factor [Anaerolineae bacterium]|nr:response regulator transcription factor [Anaerolineae bacterium]